MKTIPFLTVVSMFLFASCNKESKSQTQTTDSNVETENLPNIICISTSSESSFVKPENYYGWLLERKPPEFVLGQINSISVNNTSYAITASHVIRDLNKKKGFPKSELLEDWIYSVDSREIAVAKLKSWQDFGFKSKPLEVMNPEIGTEASIKTSVFFNPTEGVKHLVISGVIEEAKSLEELQAIAQVMGQDSGSSFGDRMNRRAPKARVLTMVVNNKFDALLPGSSGALVWQKGKPIGVFVAKFKLNEETPLVLFIEPLTDIISKLK